MSECVNGGVDWSTLEVLVKLPVLLIGLFSMSLVWAEQPPAVSLSPDRWADDYARFMSAQDVDRSDAGVATGTHGAVTVAYNGLAARAGLEALKQGGNAMDAALSAALTQVALTAGAPISYFGILSLVYYDAGSGKVYTMNAEWNTVRGETQPLTIPGSLNMSSDEGLRGTAVSGRTALIGGFMKGVGSAHDRFGKLPFKALFDPAIYIADHGMPVTQHLADKFVFRADDLRRLAETRAVFTKADGTFYRRGETFRQPALATTLRAVATQGTDYMYKGPWAKKLVAAVQADGGKMTLEDLADYEPTWAAPLVADIGGGYQIQTNGPPNLGGVNLIEAQLLANASGLATDPHWSTSGPSLRKALDVSQMMVLSYLPESAVQQIYPGLDASAAARVTPAHATELWKRMQAGVTPFRWKDAAPHHSDDVVAIDEAGNIAAITQSINCIDWGKTAIVVDGITIGDPASYQQAQIARVTPGSRLPAPTETGVLLKDGHPILGFASMGSGLHQRTMLALLNVTRFGMTVDAAINSPDFFLPDTDLKTGTLTVRVPRGRFPKSVLDALGRTYQEYDSSNVRFGGEGLWVAISRDPKTGALRAASHNRNNSAAVAW
jgi:gamma-glutamyltranspeptidase/glutathione hydrolase